MHLDMCATWKPSALNILFHSVWNFAVHLQICRLYSDPYEQYTNTPLRMYTYTLRLVASWTRNTTQYSTHLRQCYLQLLPLQEFTEHISVTVNTAPSNIRTLPTLKSSRNKHAIVQKLQCLLFLALNGFSFHSSLKVCMDFFNVFTQCLH